MKAVIMAGGKGTRIASYNSELPKPMIPLMGKPILEHQIESLRSQGIREYIFVVGHMSDMVKDYFGSGEKFGVSISWFTETSPLGTAGALPHLFPELQKDFILLNGDIIFDIDIERFIAFHHAKGGVATLFAHPGSHPFDSTLLVTDENDMVISWRSKDSPRTWYRNISNAGIHILSPEIAEYFTGQDVVDLDRDIIAGAVGKGKVYAYVSSEYIKDIGTPERIIAVEKEMADGRPSKRNFKKKQKAIFLDRDGTVNRYVGFLTDIDDFELIDGVAEAIARINRSDYLTILVTNQPVIARGEVSAGELRLIHDKMETLLGEAGAYIDGLYYCPHHPDSGFEGEVRELKTDCLCRKPKPGMLLNAARDFNIDLADSFMIGDSASDMEAAKAAGCKGILLENGLSLNQVIGELIV